MADNLENVNNIENIESEQAKNKLEITNINIRFFNSPTSKVKAFSSVIFNNSFFVNNFKIIEQKDGSLAVKMPQIMENNTYIEYAHPTNGETRRMIINGILAKYLEVTQKNHKIAPTAD